MTSYQNAVCDTCKVRKVRCDRDDPCGNCIDGNISCLRTSGSSRQPRNASKRRRVADPSSMLSKKSGLRNEIETSPLPSSHSPSLSQSPSIVEAQDFMRRQIDSAKYMSAERLDVLNSAIFFVNHLSQATKPAGPGGRSTRVVDVLEGITYPSNELLYWMLRELKGDNIGPHVLDYFKHVSPKSLKAMGLALINRMGSPETLLLYSICVNSAAFKFINTVLSGSDIGDLEDGMRARAATYHSSVKVAMARIHLLSAPSLLLLQALLCSAFIAQGSGDSTNCWAFVSAACKTCEDLGLEAQVRACQSETEDDEEVFYCCVWCHILDKSYSLMLGRSRCLLDYNGVELALSSPFNSAMSSLMKTYLHFVPVQAMLISELHPSRIVHDGSLVSRVDSITRDLLERLQRIHTRITALHGPSDSWGGLHAGSELSTIQFSYHSLRTSILRSRELCLPDKPYIDSDCLDSARMTIATLSAIQESSKTISDIRSRIAYMHWTLLYHPLTPFFVLFCNVVATSNKEDFNTLKLVTTQLDSLVDLSLPIARLQSLFNSFIGLCGGLVVENTEGHSPGTRLDHSLPVEHPQELTITSNPTVSAADPQMHSESPTEGSESQQALSNIPSPDNSASASIGDLGGLTDPGWGLFDIQPTLDWLDADLSCFNT